MECRNERRGKESKFAGGENPRRRAKNRRSYNGEKREIERMKPHVVMKDECIRERSEPDQRKCASRARLRVHKVMSERVPK